MGVCMCFWCGFCGWLWFVGWFCVHFVQFCVFWVCIRVPDWGVYRRPNLDPPCFWCFWGYLGVFGVQNRAFLAFLGIFWCFCGVLVSIGGYMNMVNIVFFGENRVISMEELRWLVFEVYGFLMILIE